MSDILARWNALEADEAAQQILPCCGSMAWARGVAARRPLSDEATLLDASDEIWRGLRVSDWIEAFSTHPRIGESQAPKTASAQSAAWSAQEQRDAASPQDAVALALAEGNREYEERFGRLFIICATGKSARQILDHLRRRLQNDADTELREAAEEQRKITNLRLKKWLSR
jgi:2-oxo-4-hydroxy-4-carboxy-5-ureidoimidazoline decarboxylase